MTSLDDLKNALLTVTDKVGHYEGFKKSDQYIVWAEDGQAAAGYTDNRMSSQVITGTVDYFTKTENDPNFGKIQLALNSIDIAWRLNSIQYEDDTKFIHYEWVFELLAEV